MDDAPDRGDSRAPEFEDLVALCRSLEREGAIKRALCTLPDNAAALVDDGDVASYRVVRVADEIVIDLLAEACGITWTEAITAGTEIMKIGDVDVPVAGKALLVRMKQTIRESDKADVRFLRMRIEEDRNRT